MHSLFQLYALAHASSVIDAYTVRDAFAVIFDSTVINAKRYDFC